MAVTRTFTLRGDFIDRITAPLENINNLLSEQVRIQRDLARVSSQAASAQRRMAQSTERSNEAIRTASDNWREFREQMTQAEVAARGIEKITDGIMNGFSNAFEKMLGAVQKSVGFVKERFGEAMRDQLDDIQAAGSVYGSLTSAGLIGDGPGGYRRAKGIYKQLDTAIGEAVKSSTAPTQTIIGFSRTLTDNILPELIKDDLAAGKSLEQAAGPAAGVMAQMYEQMALMTPAGYSPQMVSKSVQKMLQGSTIAQLSQYDFFQMNPVLINQLEKKGLEEAKTVKQRLDIFNQALKVSLAPEAIAEMRDSISGGIQALEDTFMNPTVGIFSFARAFDWGTGKAGPGAKASGAGADYIFKRRLMDQTLNSMRGKGPSRLNLNGKSINEYVEDLDTPLKIIGSTLGPFLQELANLFGTAGPVMAEVALLFNKYLGGIFRKLAFNARVLEQDVSSGESTLAFAIGRMMAEIVKGITEIFKPGGATSEVGTLVQGLIDEFMEGFNSLGHKVDWKAVTDQLMQSLSNIILLPGIRLVLAAIFISLAAPSVISGIVSAIIMSLLVPISTFMTTVVGPAIISSLAPAITGFATTIGTFIAGIGIIPIAIIALIVLVTGIIIRHRKNLGTILSQTAQIILAELKIQFNKVKLKFQQTLLLLVDALSGIVNLIRRIIPGQKDFGSGILEFQKQTSEAIKKTKDDIKEEKEFQSQAIKKRNAALQSLGQDVNQDFQKISGIVSNGWTSFTKAAGDGFNSVETVLGKSVNFIDNLGGGIETTSEKVNLVAKANERAAKNSAEGEKAAKTGLKKVLDAVKKVEAAAASAGSMGGPSSLGSAGGLKGSLGGAPISRRSTGHGYNAIDFGVPQGTKLSASMPVNITQAAFTNSAYGGLIKGTFQDGQPFLLGHMSAIGVSPGQAVKAGQVLGLTGGQPGSKGAGRSTGPHVHMEPDSIELANRFKLGYNGFIPHMHNNIMEAINMEAKNMPLGSNLMVANDSETVLTAQQSAAVDNMLANYNGRKANNSSRTINVCIKTLDPTSLNDEIAQRIGRSIAKGFDSEVASTLQRVSLTAHGV